MTEAAQRAPCCGVPGDFARRASEGAIPILIKPADRRFAERRDDPVVGTGQIEGEAALVTA
jgi:hypothetical protein